MADEPVDATAHILRQIQEILSQQGQTLAQHGQMLAVHGRRFDDLEAILGEVRGRVGEIRSGMITTLGLATNADVRQEEMGRELRDLRHRIEVLEEKV
jgi:hypothetical protein